MTVKYTNAQGKERKRLAQTIADILEVELEYKGAPTFAYQAGYCTIDKDSNVIVDDAIDVDTQEALFMEIALQGFDAEVTDLSITVLLAEDDTETFDKVQDIITSKQTLFKHALGIERPIVERTEEGIKFPWFSANCTPEENLAYRQFVNKLVYMAKYAKRITAKEREVDNEKYAFRCFLLRLGFIGDEYKQSRKILLKNLSGSSAFKSDKEAE